MLMPRPEYTTVHFGFARELGVNRFSVPEEVERGIMLARWLALPEGARRCPTDMASIIDVTQVHYPESDGKPTGETGEHRDEMVRNTELLRHFYRGQKVC